MKIITKVITTWPTEKGPALRTLLGAIVNVNIDYTLFKRVDCYLCDTIFDLSVNKCMQQFYKMFYKELRK